MFRSAFRLLVLVGLLTLPLYALSLPPASFPDTPQTMPPNPLLWDRIKRGEVKLPPHLADPVKGERSGPDSPKAVQRAPLLGAIRALAVLVDFDDKAATVNATFFDSLIFAAPVAGRGSVRDYYYEVSYGQIDIVTVNLPSSLGWRRAPQTHTYYTNANYCTGGAYPKNCRRLAEDVVDAVNAVVDFSQYDNDGDGYTESIMLVHAGPGAELTGSANDIWSHAWSLRYPRSYDGKIIADYVIMPEYWGAVSATNSDMTIGVFAHEMGHGFWDLPDLYDRDSSSYGIGDWSLMAGGSWNGPPLYIPAFGGYISSGSSPAWPDAWSRVQMGFVTPTPITTNVTAQALPMAYNNPAPTSTVFKVSSLALEEQEYFLLENRQRVTGSYDEYLDGSGLLIWHIDEAMNTYWLQNDYECTTQPRYLCSDSQHSLVALEQADGLRQLENRGNDGNSGDPFPGSTTNRTWTIATNPESSSWYGGTFVDTCVSVTNISNSGSTMTADIQTCGIPATLTTTPASPTQIDLTWVDTSPAETGFRIERSANSATDWTEIATVGANVTAYLDTSLSCDVSYVYRVRAYGRSNSAYSNIANTIIACAPATSTNLTATPISQTQIDLAWLDNSSAETGFRIERSPNGVTGWAEIATVGANITAYTDPDLTCGASAYYRVRAFNTGGSSNYSNIANTATLACALATPSSLTATLTSHTQINLAWADDNSIETGFRIERSLDGITGWSEVATVGADVTTYLDTDLTCGTSYYYRVRAYRADGSSAYSNIANATTSVCAPAGPSNLTATLISQTQIELAWADNSSTEIGFRIERSLDGLTGWVEIATVEAGITTYTEANLLCGISHYYRVRAYNAEASSGYSNIAEATTLICVPVRPSNLTATSISQTRIDLAWTDNSSAETGFRIEQSPDGITGWTEIATVSANITADAVTGLSSGTTYYYRVRAYNTGGNSTYSNMVSVTTFPSFDLYLPVIIRPQVE